MPTTVTVIFFIFWIGLLVWLRFFRSNNLPFLRLIARYPDEAYDWFLAEECWVVKDPKKTGSATHPSGATKAGLAETEEPQGCNPPFTLCVPKLNGRAVTVYGRTGEVDGSEKRFMEKYGRGKSRAKSRE